MKDLDQIINICNELSPADEQSPSAEAIKLVQSMWSWPALPAVFLHVIYTSYSIFEYLPND